MKSSCLTLERAQLAFITETWESCSQRDARPNATLELSVDASSVDGQKGFITHRGFAVISLFFVKLVSTLSRWHYHSSTSIVFFSWCGKTIVLIAVSMSMSKNVMT